MITEAIGSPKGTEERSSLAQWTCMTLELREKKKETLEMSTRHAVLSAR